MHVYTYSCILERIILYCYRNGNARIPKRIRRIAYYYYHYYFFLSHYYYYWERQRCTCIARTIESGQLPHPFRVVNNNNSRAPKPDTAFPSVEHVSAGLFVRFVLFVFRFSRGPSPPSRRKKV